MNSILNKAIWVSVLLLSLIGCDFLSGTEPEGDQHNTPTCRYVNYDHKTQTGKRILYYESGKKKSLGFFKNGMRDSLFKSWYENGNKKLEIWYADGKKEGLYKKYREGGEIYREIDYKDDLKHGQYQEYWKNGNLKYVLDYEYDFALDETLREYKSTGEKKGKFLVIDERNTVQINGMYELYVYFKDLPKQAAYTATVDGVPVLLAMKNRKGVISLKLNRGDFLMKKVQFEGFYEGRKSTIQSVKRSFNIGVEY